MSSQTLSGCEVRSYKFGALEFRTTGAGVFCPSEKLIARINAMSPDELRAANSAAWKAKRSAAKSVEKSSYGRDWDRYAHDESVAEAICKATWKLMRSAA